jgi:hypothetical protein
MFDLFFLWTLYICWLVVDGLSQAVQWTAKVTTRFSKANPSGSGKYCPEPLVILHRPPGMYVEGFIYTSVLHDEDLP